MVMHQKQGLLKMLGKVPLVWSPSGWLMAESMRRNGQVLHRQAKHLQLENQQLRQPGT